MNPLYLKAYRAGAIARQNGECVTTNPHGKIAGEFALRTWWHAGWQDAPHIDMPKPKNMPKPKKLTGKDLINSVMRGARNA